MTARGKLETVCGRDFEEYLMLKMTEKIPNVSTTGGKKFSSIRRQDISIQCKIIIHKRRLSKYGSNPSSGICCLHILYFHIELLRMREIH